jgi:hypothetical protein
VIFAGREAWSRAISIKAEIDLPAGLAVPYISPSRRCPVRGRNGCPLYTERNRVAVQRSMTPGAESGSASAMVKLSMSYELEMEKRRS